MSTAFHRSSYSTRDPEKGIAAMAQLYRGLGLRAPTDGSFEFSVSAASAGPLLAHRFRLGTTASSGTGDVSGTFTVTHVLTGRLTVDSGQDRITTRLPFLLPQGVYGGRWEGMLELGSVVLDAEAVQEHARGLLGQESLQLAFTGWTPQSPALTRYWLAEVRHLHQDVLPNTEAMEHPLVRGTAFRSLATALLHCFPNTFLTQSPPPGSARVAPARLRRATAFVDEHLDEDIGLAGIARAAGMSPRGLQVAFRRELGTTPIAYLRDARLEAAHRDLREADPAAGATVAGIAARWGFPHTGRFAAAYRRRFGQSPGTTLHG